MRPQNLLGRRQRARRRGIGPLDSRGVLHRVAELAAPECKDATRAADLVFFRRQRYRRVVLAARHVGEGARIGVERELVALLRVEHRLGALHHVQPEVEGVAAEDVAHVVTAHDHHLESCFLGNALQSRGAHLARGPDGEAIARDHERLAAVHAGAEVRHQVAERSGLPALIQRLEAFGHAIGGRRDLVGVDGIELLARHLRVPEHQRLAAKLARRTRGHFGCLGACERFGRHAGLEPGWLERMHEGGPRVSSFGDVRRVSPTILSARFVGWQLRDDRHHQAHHGAPTYFATAPAISMPLSSVRTWCFMFVS